MSSHLAFAHDPLPVEHAEHDNQTMIVMYVGYIIGSYGKLSFIVNTDYTCIKSK